MTTIIDHTRIKHLDASLDDTSTWVRQHSGEAAPGFKTTLVEDAAYSLFGIFSVSLPVTYGEGDQALGRLLAQILTSSGDTSILAWTGKSGSFNSCLPGHIHVFSQLSTSHIPPSMTDTEMETITATLRASFLNLDLVMTLYDRLQELPVPSFLGKRMKLSCLTFRLGPLSVSRTGSERVFRVQTTALGIVEIRNESSSESEPSSSPPPIDRHTAAL